MVDIAVCDRRDCAKKNSCFRYLAERDEYGQYHLDIRDLLYPVLLWTSRNAGNVSITLLSIF